MFCENPFRSAIFGLLSGLLGGTIAMLLYPTIIGAVIFSALIATLTEIANHAGIFDNIQSEDPIDS